MGFWHEWEPTFIAAAGVTVLATAGAVLTPLDSWYRNLKKPTWQPPDFVFRWPGRRFSFWKRLPR